MKSSCYKSRFSMLIYILALFIAISIIIFAITKAISTFNPKSAVVYYGDNPPYDLLGSFDISIVEPGHGNTNTLQFKRHKEKFFAYVSIGEVEKNRSYYSQIKKEWIIGENKLWESKLLNLANREYQEFLINHVIKDLMKEGYKNFFFDTVDSYHLLSLNEKMRNNYEDDIVLFLKKLKKKYPDIKLILNRGFEIIDRAYPYIDGVLFESLFYGLDNKTLDYHKVSQKDREWLLTKVKNIKSYDLIVIALDYLPPSQKEKAKDIAKEIKSLNIVPYIGDKHLHNIGTSFNKPARR